MHRLGLRAKILAGAIALLLPLFALELYAIQERFETRRESARAELARTAGAGAVLVAQIFGDLVALAAEVAAEPQIDELSEKELLMWLSRSAAYRETVDNLGVIDADGTFRAALVRPPGSDVPGPGSVPFFTDVRRAGTPLLSDVFASEVLGGPVVVAAAPLVAAEGLAFAALRVAELARLVRSLHPGSGQEIFLIDPTGRIALHTAQRQLAWQQRDVGSLQAVRDAQAGATVYVEELAPLFPAGGIAVLAPVAEQRGWVLGISWSRDAILGELEARRSRRLGVFGLISLAGLVGAFLLAAWLSRPVRQLALQAHAIGSGDLGARVHVRSRDELRDLADSFNAMAEALAQERSRRETFVAAVAHDLKNALAPILTAAQLLGRKLEGEPEKKRIGTIVEQTRRLQRMITDLSDLARIEGGQFSLECGPVDLAALARGTAEMEQTRTSLHRISVDARGDTTIEGDADRLAQVLVNLINNAVKYSPAGGDVLVEVVGSAAEVEVLVRDEGLGLSREDAAALFVPYVRRHREAAPGLGLGLFISRAIVEAHGGTIHAESAGPGQGTTMRFALPRSRPG